MTDIVVQQMPIFKKAYKKLHKEQKKIVNKAISTVINNPKIGEEKKGDLAGVYVYKFKIHDQQYLLAYEWDPLNRLLLVYSMLEFAFVDRLELPVIALESVC